MAAFCEYPKFECVPPGVAAMKTVSMLVACLFVLGAAGTAHATDARLHGCLRVADGGASNHGLLAALGAVLSGNDDDTTTTPASGSSNHADNDDSAHGSLPDSAASTSTPSSSNQGGSSTPPTAPRRPPPALGWQSLLPGSIQ
jgi:hypothetical protein